jgi:hypothetical protein
MSGMGVVMAQRGESGSAQERQLQQQQVQQSAHPPTPAPSSELPEKQHQTRHNPISERFKGIVGTADQ